MDRDQPDAHEISEMVRAFIGLLNAKISDDDAGVHAQLAWMIKDQWAASEDKVNIFGARMAKQVEAGAIVAHTLINTLAPRAGMTVPEVLLLLAREASFNEFGDDSE